jgi:tripartite-type tricarboxylate transporter receptor subunit TctC
MGDVMRILTFKQVAFIGVATFALIGPGSAQPRDDYPSQTLKLIVPFAAGGLPDTVARIVATSLQTRLKQTVAVENRPGSGGGAAAVAIASAPPDGYQLIVTDNSFLSTNPYLYRQLPYSLKEFITVAQVANAPLFLALHPKVPAKTMKEFIDYARSNPGKIDYGSSGVGTMHHLSMEAIKAHFKLDMAHVPFRGTGQSVPACLAAMSAEGGRGQRTSGRDTTSTSGGKQPCATATRAAYRAFQPV